ncbi:MAG: maleylacetoacetate isomerase [Gammaproteobacteria bacterium]|jgi:maleylacetoacetate isomerase/maleylpyruvate isomerase
MFELHEFNLSVSSCRVRIGLRLKGVAYQSIPVPLVKGGGEQHLPEYRALNPQGLVPTYNDQKISLSQSLAILEYLDESYPEPAFLPGDAVQRARARQIAQIIACDIQPLTNLRVLAYLRNGFRAEQNARSLWFRQWLLDDLDALELWLTAERGMNRYCVNEQITLADICLVPQLYQARRFKLPLDDFPRLRDVEAACPENPAYRLGD